ncbi:MAG: TetR family transcriptional regulator [Paraburkholderia sp.]|jgi:AcrR family transcriptional regulator|uniref:TetR/AcrR family transcriptional regulator n=1 Tax=Burkholderiaceae TaxID=119060 RepID=UPI0010F96208|nr:TetR/AcrR family transcriptional regulator [Burkholderia sp. 4M9327F10]
MSVLTTKSPPKTRNAASTREKILEAARECFSRRSYENVGLREIAAEAGVDAALVSRYFGGKEGLFEAVVAGAFHVDEHLPVSGGLAGVGEFLIRHIMRDSDDVGGFDPLRLLLLAAANPETAAIVSTRFQEEFVKPLSARLSGDDAEIRANVIASYVIGLAAARHLLHAPGFGASAIERVVALAGGAIQHCVAPGDA